MSNRNPNGFVVDLCIDDGSDWLHNFKSIWALITAIRKILGFDKTKDEIKCIFLSFVLIRFALTDLSSMKMSRSSNKSCVSGYFSSSSPDLSFTFSFSTATGATETKPLLRIHISISFSIFHRITNRRSLWMQRRYSCAHVVKFTSATEHHSLHSCNRSHCWLWQNVSVWLMPKKIGRHFLEMDRIKSASRTGKVAITSGKMRAEEVAI